MPNRDFESDQYWPACRSNFEGTPQTQPYFIAPVMVVFDKAFKYVKVSRADMSFLHGTGVP